MRSWLTTVLTLGVLLGVASVRADEKEEKLEALKKKALENWKKIEGGAEAIATTEHFLILAPKELEGKLKDHGALLEKHFELANKALFTGKEVPVKNLITVYLLDKPDHIEVFIRRIERKRPLRQESACFNADDDVLHIAATQREKSEASVEVIAAQEVASMLMQRKAGVRTILPEWLRSGFGRATYYRADPKATAVVRERGMAVRLLMTKKNRNASDVWSDQSDDDDIATLNASVADFFGYGPARMKLPAMLEAFRPGENEERKSMAQALEAVELKVDVINKRFREWALRPN